MHHDIGVHAARPKAGRRSLLRLPNIVTGPIARAAAGTFLLRILHAALRFLISLVLARLLGATGYGAYVFALTCVGVLSIPALLGYDGLLVREIAGYRPRSQWALLQGLLRRAGRTVLVTSVAVALVAAGLAWALSAHLERPLLVAVWVILPVLPFLALMRIKQAIMTGLRRVVVGQLAETIVQPVLFLALIGVFVLLPFDRRGPPVLIGLYGASILVAFLVAAGLARKIQAALVEPAAPQYETARWRRSGLRFACIGGLSTLGASLGVIMLGPLSGAAATGVFAAVTAIAALSALPLTAINTSLGPAISAVVSAGRKDELQRLATKAARGALLFSLPLAVAYILLGEWVLRVFGPEFSAGYAALVILSVGQVVNAAMGSVGTLLQMAGHERDVAIGLAVSITGNFVVNLVLIPLWGVNGAALGATCNLIL